MTSDAMEEGLGPVEVETTRDVRLGRRRRLLLKLRRATRVIEQREQLQDIGYGLLASALALSLPATGAPGVGSEALRRMQGEDVITQGLLFPIGRGAQELGSSTTPETALRLLSGLFFGGALMLTLAFLRGLGFRRTTTVPAAFAAFATPFAWLGATSPIDYAPGIFGASLVLWTLFHQEQSTPRGYQWRAILAFGCAYMLHMEIALLVPAVAWAVARHPSYRSQSQVHFLSVTVVLVMSIAIGISGAGESARAAHLVDRALAGADDYSIRTLGRWALALPVGLGVILFGLYQMLFAVRTVEAKRAPRWVVPWCLAALAPVVAGSPAATPIAPYLVPAGALGIADWLNRRGTSAREARAGALLVAAQVLATALVIAAHVA